MRLINLLNSISLNLLDNDITVTLSIDDLFVGETFSISKHLLVLCLCFLFCLGLLNDSSLDLLLKQVILSPVLILEQSQLLLLFILKSKLKILLFLLMVLELDLKTGLLGQGADQLWVDEDTSDATLLESNTILVELLVELRHHIGGHVRLEIEDLVQEDSIDKVSDILLDFSSQ